MIKAVLFDVDGVLIDSKEANVAFYKALLEGFGYHDIAPEELERGHYMSLLEAVAYLTKEPSEERVREMWEVACRLEDYPFDLLQLPPDCAEVVASLAESYRLGIVTSRIREGVEHFFTFSRLRPHFEVAISYEDYEQPKPAPDPLLVACERLGVAPADTVYIGDAEYDRLAAEAAGTRFIAFGDAIEDPACAVTSFRELETVLRELAYA